MKKLVVLLLVMVSVFALFANGVNERDLKKIYVLGATPDSGWLAQAGAFAERRCAELQNNGTNAVFMSADSGNQQVGQVNSIITNQDADIVVVQVIDKASESAIESLVSAKIPVIQFNTSGINVNSNVLLNFTCDDIACGAGAAYWLQYNGMKPYDNIVFLCDEDNSSNEQRTRGFADFLKGDIDYTDNATGRTYHSNILWTNSDVEKALTKRAIICDSSADVAERYLREAMTDLLYDAKLTSGNLYICCTNDSLAFGVLKAFESATVREQANAKKLNICIVSIGGMQKYYDVMSGKSLYSGTADTYFDKIASVSYNPSMFVQAINYAVDYVNGKLEGPLGLIKINPVFLVDRKNVVQYEGYQTNN